MSAKKVIEPRDSMLQARVTERLKRAVGVKAAKAGITVPDLLERLIFAACEDELKDIPAIEIEQQEAVA